MTKRLVRDGLREAVEPVRKDAERRLLPYSAKSAHGYRTVVRRTGVVSVEQRIPRTKTASRRRPKFVGFQFDKALVPAERAKKPEVLAAMEKQVQEIGNVFPGRI
jgi:hypothetical protein